jgi:hypothetical protein
MRKFLLALAAVAMVPGFLAAQPAAAQGVPPGSTRAAIVHERHEIRQDRRELRKDRREMARHRRQWRQHNRYWRAHHRHWR